MEGTRRRTIRLTLAVTLTVVAIGASIATTVAQTEPSVSPVIHGWPGARGEPAGLYSWRVGRSEAWMHKVPGTWTAAAPTSVEMSFVTLEGPYYEPPAQSVAVAGADLDGPYAAIPERAADERLQTWRLDVGDAKVAVIIRSFSDTDPALVAEAEAVIESITVQPTEDGDGSRLAFALQDGWDSG